LELKLHLLKRYVLLMQLMLKSSLLQMELMMQSCLLLLLFYLHPCNCDGCIRLSISVSFLLGGAVGEKLNFSLLQSTR
jgi:lipoprotein signal peptidase